MSANFAATDPATLASPDTPPVLTSDPSLEVGGSRSLLGDSRGSRQEWNEFFHSRAGLFRPNEAYRVSFDYKAVARADDAEFYALFRRAGQNNAEGWTSWRGAAGATGRVTLSLAPRHASDYYLIIGLHCRGKIAVNALNIETDPAHRPVEAAMPAPVRAWVSPGNTKYYVNARLGNDAATGRSAQQAWRSLTSVNTRRFAPGDTILLRAGSRWTGFLSPGGSGSVRQPIVLTRYGDGPKPQIDAQGRFLAALALSNAESWVVSGLDIANKGNAP